jgi:hypothetical protein
MPTVRVHLPTNFEFILNFRHESTRRNLALKVCLCSKSPVDGCFCRYIKMGKRRKREQLTQDEIWDDSALLKSWQGALDEYQVSDLGSISLITHRHSFITASTPKARMLKTFCARQNPPITSRRKMSLQHDLWMARHQSMATLRREKSMSRKR